MSVSITLFFGASFPEVTFFLPLPFLQLRANCRDFLLPPAALLGSRNVGGGFQFPPKKPLFGPSFLP